MIQTTDFIANVINRITRYEQATSPLFRPSAKTRVIDSQHVGITIGVALEGNAEKEEEVAVVAWTTVVASAMKVYANIASDPCLTNLHQIPVINHIEMRVEEEGSKLAVTFHVEIHRFE